MPSTSTRGFSKPRGDRFQELGRRAGGRTLPGPDRDDERDLFDGEDGYEGGSMDDDEREPGGAE